MTPEQEIYERFASDALRTGLMFPLWGDLDVVTGKMLIGCIREARKHCAGIADARHTPDQATGMPQLSEDQLSTVEKALLSRFGFTWKHWQVEAQVIWNALRD